VIVGMEPLEPGAASRRAARAARGLTLALGVALLQLLWPCFADPVAAQEVVIPNFWDPRAIPERPDTLPTRAIRFLTDDEFPPLHFAGPDGAPTGFSVELARAACETLGITCTVQVRRFDTLLDSLAQGQGDVIASGSPSRERCGGASSSRRATSAPPPASPRVATGPRPCRARAT
jgi:ABC-type amino acid transport substrate-binding protein